MALANGQPRSENPLSKVRRKRRAWGAIEQLESGRFRARVLGPDGRYLPAPTTFASRTDAGVWLDVQHADMVRGLWKAPRSSGPTTPAYTVGEYVARWIEQHPNAKNSTKELYRGLLRGCIFSTLGQVKLTGVTADAVRDWYYRLGQRLAADVATDRERLRKAGKAPSGATVRDGRTRQAQAYRLLRAALTTAHADGLITEQPCRLAGGGTPRSSAQRKDLSARLLTATQVAQVAVAMPPRYRVLVLAAAWSGLRQGELLALTRADLDLNVSRPVVRVRRRVRRGDLGTVEVDTPKSAASVRTVTLPGPLRDALAVHLAEFVPMHVDALVFATSRGTVLARSNLLTMLRRATTSAGVPNLRFHDLRHCAQVLAAESGATLPELMARMGHSSPNAALVYMHARAERDGLISKALGEAMSAAAEIIPLRRVTD